MKSVIFTFTTHNHQPLGNFDHVIEEAYQKSYLPFFELAEKYPIRFGTHFTGILLDWLEAKHPEHLAKLRDMVERDQLEIVSGGFFEPILSVIPYQDQQAQITLLTSKIEELFGTRATGMWLAERVWEQPLASSLHEAGIRYVLLDDTHFLHAGLKESDLNGYYLTEDRGKTLAVFPISKALRYTIPFQNVDETIRVLRDASSESETNIVTFADDGEKFGVWPRTFDHVYGKRGKEGWLEELFRKLAENQSWIRMMHPGEVIRSIAPRGRIYLPNASYAEMTEWALPTSAITREHEDFVHVIEASEEWKAYMPFVRGGFWRNFLVMYPEINQLHKHMLRTSARLADAKHKKLGVADAERELLASQCNDPYWHGVFGGAYLPNLRHANFSALVRADRLLDEAQHVKKSHIIADDIDCDGAKEVVLESRELAVYVKPSLGGMIAEIDFKPRDFNAMNIISRRQEAYHHKLTEAAANPDAAKSTKSIHDMVESKEPGLEKLLIYDWYRRGSFIEHFLDHGVAAEGLRTNSYSERGDFVSSAYDWREQGANLLVSRNGQVGALPVRLEKSLRLHEGQLQVTYRVTNDSEEPLRYQLASEWALNLLAPDAHDRFFEVNGQRLEHSRMNSSGTVQGGKLRLVDEYLKLAISIDAHHASEIIRYPLESISNSEAGFERIFQGSILLAMWPLDIAPHAEWQAQMSVTFEAL
jgi:4-alpha-glucanotransferase